MSIRFIAKSKLPTRWGNFVTHAFEDDATNKCHLALTYGELDLHEPNLLRIHSECLTGDALFSLRCDCGSQLQQAMEQIAYNNSGVILYLKQEGRGIGLANKIRAYQLQDEGYDTVEANNSLGFDADLRQYDICQPILEHLNIHTVVLMTNNLLKVSALENLGIKVTQRVSHHHGENTHNAKYLKTKAEKLGHQYDH